MAGGGSEMTPAQKIAENNMKVKAWLQSARARRDDRIEDASERQRDFLNRQRRKS